MNFLHINIVQLDENTHGTPAIDFFLKYLKVCV